MKTTIDTFREDTGQTMAEYGVTLGVITVGIVLALTGLAQVTVSTIQRVAGYL